MSFSSILPARIRLPGASASQYELPMYNSPPHSPVAFPPPSVTTSMHSSSPNRRNASKPTQRLDAMPRSEDRILLRRREKQIELDLQELLDAQSDALMSGAAHRGAIPFEDDVLSIHSATPTIRSPEGGHEVMSRRVHMTPGIARREIYKSMRELATIKTQEEDITRREKKDCLATQRHLEGWDKKRARLRKEIDTLQNQDTRVRTEVLQDEADKLQDEITQTEQRLAHMRQRHRSIIDEIAETENSVQSKLTSYVTSLNMLDDEIHAYLAKPPFPIPRSKNERTFLTLPASRRTLDMAREYVAAQASSLDHHNQSVHGQKEALAAGSMLWKRCIAKVEQFERHLKKEMSSLTAENSENSIRVLLGHMNEVISSVELDLGEAETQKWNLLIACIGAELDAFKQGRSILEQAAGVIKEQDNHNLLDHHADKADKNDEDDEDLSHWPGIDDAEPQWQTEVENDAHWPGPEAQDEPDREPAIVWTTPRASKTLAMDNDEEDEGPDPDLMVSRLAREDSNDIE